MIGWPKVDSGNALKRRENQGIYQETLCNPNAPCTEVFPRQRVATLPELKTALGTAVGLTVFRKLAMLDYTTSYSHRGACYTLHSLARYYAQGLWSHQDVRFSRYGTLLDTAAELTTRAPADYFTGELDAIVEVPAKDALRQRVERGRLQRRPCPERFLYGVFCIDLPKESQELDVAIAREAMAADLAGGHVQGGKKSRGAMPHVIVGPGAAATWLEGQPRLRTIQCLNLAFLVDAKHHGILRRIEINAHHIEPFFETKNPLPLSRKRVPKMAGWTGLEPAAFCVTGRRSNQLSYHPEWEKSAKRRVGRR